VRLLVTFALAGEFAPWRKGERFERDGETGGREAYRMRQGAIQVVVLLTSVGPENAAAAVGRFLDTTPADLVISSGMAGGLQRGFEVGDVLVGRAVRRADDGCELRPPLKWLERARELGAKEALMVTSTRVAVTLEDKRRLAAQADAVEMESFAVMEQAAARGIPAIAIRAISDAGEEELPIDFNRIFDSGGRVRAGRVACELLRRPFAIAGLVRLVRKSRQASMALAEFLERFIATAAREFPMEELAKQPAK
jgi:nucleoside phosphorylase